MHQLFCINVCSDLLLAVINGRQCWKPVRHGTHISINQSIGQFHMPTAVHQYLCALKAFNTTLVNKYLKKTVGDSLFSLYESWGKIHIWEAPELQNRISGGANWHSLG